MRSPHAFLISLNTVGSSHPCQYINIVLKPQSCYLFLLSCASPPPPCQAQRANSHKNKQTQDPGVLFGFFFLKTKESPPYIGLWLMHSFSCERKHTIPLIGPCLPYNNVLSTILLCWYKQQRGGKQQCLMCTEKCTTQESFKHPPTPVFFFFLSYQCFIKHCCSGEGALLLVARKARKSHA